MKAVYNAKESEPITLLLLQHGADPNRCAPSCTLGTHLRAVFVASDQFNNPSRLDRRLQHLINAELKVYRESSSLMTQDADKIKEKLWSEPVVTYQRLIDLATNPLLLKMACIVRIREVLVWATGGRSIILRVKRFPLPDGLQRALTFD